MAVGRRHAVVRVAIVVCLAAAVAWALFSFPGRVSAQTTTPPSSLPDYSIEGRQPLEYLWENVPGGSPVLVSLSILTVVCCLLVVGRGEAWSGPAAAGGAVITVGLLNAMDQVGSLAATVIIVLALLSGLAFFRAARVR